MGTRIKKHKFEFKDFSWSAMSSFAYDREQWHRKYCLGIIDPPNAQMLFGNVIGERLAKDPKFLPEVPRYTQFEKKLEGKIGGIPLVSFLDSFDPKEKHFLEYKTSSNNLRWTQKKAQDHGQLLFYKFLIYLNYGIDPSNIKCQLVYIPVQENGGFQMELSKEKIVIFDVKHTAVDILKFAAEIKKTYKEMLEYADLKAEGLL